MTKRALHVCSGVFLALAFGAATLLAHGTERHSFRLVNGLWFDGRAFVSRTVFTVDGVFRDSYDGKVEVTLDLSGKYVIAPFGDAHDHALGGGPDPEGQVKAFLAQGVFYLKNPNELPRLAAPFRAIVNQPRSIDVTYANGGLTSSGGHPVPLYETLAEKGALAGITRAELEGQAFFVVNDPTELAAKWPAVLAGKPDFIKVYLEHSEDGPRRRGLDPALVPEIVKRAHAASLRVTAHARTAADFRAAVAAGVDELAHLPLARLTEEDARRAASAKVTVVTTTLSHWDKEGLSDALANEIHRANLALLVRAGVPIVFGVDGHAPILAEVENVRRLGVFDGATLLRMLTEATPRAIFPDRKIGSLAEGFEASFLALDGDPLRDFSALHRISMRMKQGYVLRFSTSVAEPVGEAVRSGGPGAAVTRYRELKADPPDKWDFSEPELNRLGYALLKEGKVKEAAAVLGLNAEAYPSSPNAFDSLSDALLAAGDREGARAAARKVLELLPTVHGMPDGFRKSLEESARKKLD